VTDEGRRDVREPFYLKHEDCFYIICFLSSEDINKKSALTHGQYAMVYISLAPDGLDPALKNTLQSCGVTQWVYLGEDSTWRIRAESVLSPEIQRLSIADLLDAASIELRQPYIDWIGGLSKKNASPEWWSCELAAKNPYHLFYVRVCLLAVVKKLLAGGMDDDTLIVCSTPALFEGVAQCADEQGILWRDFRIKRSSLDLQSLRQRTRKNLERIAQVLPPSPIAGNFFQKYQRFLEQDLRYRRRILSSYGIKDTSGFSGKDTVLFFTWVDRRNFAAGSTYTDSYFGPLPRMFKEKGYRVAFVPRVLFTMPFEEAVQRLIKTDETFFFPEQFITPGDLRACRKHQDGFNPVIEQTATIENIPVFALAREHIEQTRKLLADNLVLSPLIASMHERGIRPHKIIHTCEGHSWEQALSFAVHRSMPETTVIGYDNVTFSRLVLSMYPAQCEYGIRPLPDLIVTNGPLYKKVLLGEGLPPEMIRTGCALRHTYLWNNTPGEKDKPIRDPGEPVRILVATAIGLGDSVELVAKACDAFGGDDRFRILVKCHPLVDPEAVRKYLSGRATHTNISFEKRSVNELLQNSHILLYTYTSVCFEAMIHGVVPVCVRAENFLNLDKLDGAPEIRWHATTPQDLRTAVEQILAMPKKEREAWQVKARQIVKEALAPVSAECINAFLE